MGVEQRLELIFSPRVKNCPADSLSLLPGNWQAAGSVEQKSLGWGRGRQGCMWTKESSCGEALGPGPVPVAGVCGSKTLLSLMNSTLETWFWVGRGVRVCNLGRGAGGHGCLLSSPLPLLKAPFLRVGAWSRQQVCKGRTVGRKRSRVMR